MDQKLLNEYVILDILNQVLQHHFCIMASENSIVTVIGTGTRSSDARVGAVRYPRITLHQAGSLQESRSQEDVTQR